MFYYSCGKVLSLFYSGDSAYSKGKKDPQNNIIKNTSHPFSNLDKLICSFHISTSARTTHVSKNTELTAETYQPSVQPGTCMGLCAFTFSCGTAGRYGAAENILSVRAGVFVPVFVLQAWYAAPSTDTC